MCKPQLSLTQITCSEAPVRHPAFVPVYKHLFFGGGGAEDNPKHIQKSCLNTDFKLDHQHHWRRKENASVCCFLKNPLLLYLKPIKQTSLRLHCTRVQKFSGVWRNGSTAWRKGRSGGCRGRRTIASHSSHSDHLQKLRSHNHADLRGPESLLKLHLPGIKFPALTDGFCP